MLLLQVEKRQHQAEKSVLANMTGSARQAWRPPPRQYPVGQRVGEPGGSFSEKALVMTFSLKQSHRAWRVRKADLAYIPLKNCLSFSSSSSSSSFFISLRLSYHFDRTEPCGTPEIPGTRFVSEALTNIAFHTQPQLEDELLGILPLFTKGLLEEHSRHL